jgi:hypothetical protein
LAKEMASRFPCAPSNGPTALPGSSQDAQAFP